MPWVYQKTGKGQGRGQGGQEQNRRQPYWRNLPNCAGIRGRHGVIRISSERPNGKCNAYGVQAYGRHNQSETKQPLTPYRDNDRDYGPKNVCANSCGRSKSCGFFRRNWISGTGPPTNCGGTIQYFGICGIWRARQFQDSLLEHCFECRNHPSRETLRFETIRV